MGRGPRDGRPCRASPRSRGLGAPVSGPGVLRHRARLSPVPSLFRQTTRSCVMRRDEFALVRRHTGGVAAGQEAGVTEPGLQAGSPLTEPCDLRQRLAGRRSRLGDRFTMPNPSDPEPAGGVEAAREVIACAERTLAAPSARIELRQELGLEWPRAPGWRGGVLRLAVKTGGLLMRAWWWLATRRGPNHGLAFGQMLGEGFAEPARGRYMIDF